MTDQFNVAVIGAGPAGLFAARELATLGARVALFNRDVKPGGLAEYGIYPDKHVMKEGLRKQFRQALENPNLHYYGNVSLGVKGDLTLDDLRSLGCDAILVAVGAQGTKWLELPGEDLEGVYHAKDVVYFYNKLPPFSRMKFRFGKRVIIVGAGNVMVDIARYLIREAGADEVTAVVRRGPAEVNFTKEEMKHIIGNLDLQAFDSEMSRIRPALDAVQQDSEIGRHKVMDALAKGDPKFGEARFKFEFLASPVRMLGENGVVTQLEIEDNLLTLKDGQTKPKGTGHKRTLDADTVIFAIGDKVDESFGLPVESNEFIKNPAPRFPMDGNSYEAFDPQTQKPIEDVFVGGWSRKASEGLVGVARKDGINAARSVWAYLQTQTPRAHDLAPLVIKLKSLDRPVVTNDDIKKLEAVESAEAQKRGVEEFKYASNEEMLNAIGLAKTAEKIPSP
ncbi:MAG TPA: FAD-dependent oxidoreductase [Anaerolineales bacterium]